MTPLSDSQRSLLTLLLSIDFPGVDELRAQLPFASVEDETVNTGFLICVAPGAPAAPVVSRIPVEARCSEQRLNDEGEPVTAFFQVLLAVVDGYLAEVDVLVAGIDEGVTSLPPLDAFSLVPTPALRRPVS